jgi:Cu/Ag efflux protein CusF
MKTKPVLSWSVGVLAALALTTAADQGGALAAKEKLFIGKVDYVNAEEHTVTVAGYVRHRTFDLGRNCVITLWDKAAGCIDDLRPGQRITVDFQNVHGVLAADQVLQEARRGRGVVEAIDPAQRRLVLRHGLRKWKFAVAPDCKVKLNDKESGALASIKPGDHVTVIYESPSGPEVVRQIAQTSVSFTGSVAAVDLPHRTISVDASFGSKRFTTK